MNIKLNILKAMIVGTCLSPVNSFSASNLDSYTQAAHLVSLVQRVVSPVNKILGHLSPDDQNSVVEYLFDTIFTDPNFLENPVAYLERWEVQRGEEVDVLIPQDPAFDVLNYLNRRSELNIIVDHSKKAKLVLPPGKTIHTVRWVAVKKLSRIESEINALILRVHNNYNENIQDLKKGLLDSFKRHNIDMKTISRLRYEKTYETGVPGHVYSIVFIDGTQSKNFGFSVFSDTD